MKFSRFERKILAAIVGVALVPMIGALFLGQAVLREAYGVGVNPRVGEQLQRGLSLYQEHFTVLRQGAEQAATAIADDYLLRAALRSPTQAGVDAGVDAGLDAQRPPSALQPRLRALMRSYPTVAAIRVLQGEDGVPMAQASDASRSGGEVRMLKITRAIDAVGTAVLAVEVTVAAPSAPFLDYQRAGELAEVYSRLEHGSGRVSTFYLLVYMGFLASAIVLAVAVGVVLSRRVTRRVLLLADATSKVGRGDLSVTVPTDVNDEVGELTRAFNTMVRDIRDSRTRIEYLQRIGAWQQFARHLAHEIKNPLTPIQLAIQEVHRSYQGDDARYRGKLDDAKAIIEEEVASLRRMVGEFSAFARLPEAALVSADLGEFLRDVGPALESIGEEYASADGAPMSVLVEVGDDPLPVLVDAMMFKRCIDNLVRNSLQALRDAGTGGKVTVRTQRVDGDAIIEVVDDGPGISAEDLPQVFDPYFTTKSDGTGLGLPIVKKIVLEHNGEITAASRPGQGAEVRIALPLVGALNS